MPDASPTPAPPQPDRSGGALVHAALSVIREGADQVRRADVLGPPPSSRVRQFVHGVCLPFVVWRRLVATPERRRRYWRTVLAQALVTVAVALAFVFSGDRWSRDDQSESAELRAAALKFQEAARGLQEEADELVAESARPAPVAAPPPAHPDVAKQLSDAFDELREEVGVEQAEEESEDAAEDEREPGAPAAVPGPPAAAPGPPEEGPLPHADEEALSALLDTAAREVASAKSPEAKLRAAAVRFDEGARRLEERAGELDKKQEAGLGAFRWLVHKGLLFWAALVSALYSVQLVVLWLTRDFHDAISREASLAIGLEPEDPPLRPRVRLNLHWVRMKLRRRWRGALAIFTVAPLLWLVTGPLPYADELRTVLTSAWLAYWWVVFTSSKSARAWMEPARDPWYLRGWTFLTSKVPPFRWGLPRAYGRFWRHFTLELYAPATCVELQPYAMTGLALTRFLGSVPVVKLFARPIFPVAAALLVEERRRAAVNPSGGAGAASR